MPNVENPQNLNDPRLKNHLCSVPKHQKAVEIPETPSDSRLNASLITCAKASDVESLETLNDHRKKYCWKCVPKHHFLFQNVI